jgi:predicted GIY-YIG superfamily endonuclease
MPKTQIDYSKTIMYKIVPKDLNNNYIYVGSTTDFTKRKYTHKASCFN